MLVLSRKRNQSVIIGDGIVVTVLSCKAGTVLLGIEAPADVLILRGELLPVDAAGRDERRCGVTARRNSKLFTVGHMEVVDTKGGAS
jgi:carbon storage regulator